MVDLIVTTHTYDQLVTSSALPTSPPCYGLDIETDTTIDGLDPRRSTILAVAIATESGDEVFMGGEDQILSRTDEFLAGLPPGLLVTWNGSSFDMPFISDRAECLGVELGLHSEWRHLAPPHDGASSAGYHVCRWGLHRHLDGYRLYRADVARLLGVSCGLKPLSKMLGLTPVEVDRTRIHELDAAEMRSYVASDARLAREIVLRRMPAAASNVDPVPIESVTAERVRIPARSVYLH